VIGRHCVVERYEYRTLNRTASRAVPERDDRVSGRIDHLSRRTRRLRERLESFDGGDGAAAAAGAAGRAARAGDDD
jgi:hypothetical protein